MTVGRMVILPSTYVGSPRSLQQNYLDSMTTVQKFGSPDLFITMTCNPEWPEIKNHLNENQRVEHRPDLVARVFNLKIKELLNDLLKVNIFGKVAAMMSVVEFQKRGLPHIHILIILTSEYKIRNSEAIDKIVCAEIPDIETESELYSIIKKCNVHGPCGILNPKSPCMTNLECTKRFPKEFEPETLSNVNGYPLYRRRDNNSKIAFFERGGKFKYDVDNRWIVPYNKYLSYKYNCHINVEICASVKSVKYLFKYIYKGHDCANVKVSTEGQIQLHWDEVSFYLDARYVSPPEPIWRIFAYDMQFKTHSIYRLAVHMENHQSILFTPGEEELAILNHIDTTLTAWFKLNLTSVDSRKYFYTEIPEHFVFNRKKIWTQRKRSGSKIIARLYSVSPKEGERFYLRLVLLHIRGATSYIDLRTVNGTLYSTFAKAAKALGLLKDDSQWNRCLEEASLSKMPKQLRQLFAFICIFCEPTDVKQLWDTHIDCLCEDYNLKYDKENAKQLAVNDVIDILITHNCNYLSFGLPEKQTVHVEVNNDSDNQQTEHELGLNYSSQLNLEQRNIFDNIMLSINDDNEKQKCYFIDGPGGSGKTFLYTTILHVVRGLGLTAVSVAWTGIAATLLKNGRTLHSLFKLPVPLNVDSTSSIRHNSVDGRLLKEAKLIIWDEVTMAPYFALDIIDTCLRDLMNNNKPFGNKIMLLGGDFRQCLPVVKRGSVQDILASCIQNSSLWSVFSVQHLTINMRVSEEENEFITWLLKIGDGLISDLPDSATRVIKIPSNFIANKSLVDEIYEDINLIDITDLKSRVILCPLNEHTLEINEEVLNILSGETITYLSNDSVSADSEAEQNNFPIEFLNSLTPAGMPPHKLNLKVGAIIMLLRNMSPKNGLCNGTRLTVKELHSSVIVAEIISGSHSGNRAFLPKIILAPSDINLPFTLKRIQFPIRLAFAMTINKSQGQTFEKVGVLLREPVFAHGQLYVALSRVKSSNNLKIEISDPKNRKSNTSAFTSNVVYQKVLLS